MRARHAGVRVLLAEDNPVNQEVATALLHNAGLCVDVAEDGARALAMVQRGGCALVLMDMRMPVMNGFGPVAPPALGRDSKAWPSSP